MIDNFLGLIQREDTGHYGFCHRMWHAVMILFCSDDSSFFFLKDRSSLQYFITQGMGQSSMLLRVGGGKGGIPGWLHTCLL